MVTTFVDQAVSFATIAVGRPCRKQRLRLAHCRTVKVVQAVSAYTAEWHPNDNGTFCLWLQGKSDSLDKSHAKQPALTDPYDRRYPFSDMWGRSRAGPCNRGRQAEKGKSGVVPLSNLEPTETPRELNDPL